MLELLRGGDVHQRGPQEALDLFQRDLRAVAGHALAGTAPHRLPHATHQLLLVQEEVAGGGAAQWQPPSRGVQPPRQPLSPRRAVVVHMWTVVAK